MVPLALLAGLGMAWFYTRSYIGGYGWLRDIGGLFRFMLWPRPPLNAVKIVEADGRTRLYYDVDVREDKDKIVILTEHGLVKAVGARGVPAALTQIYLPGHPSPMHFVVAGLSGLVAVYIVLYYGLGLMGLVPLNFAAFGVLLYAYAWYQAAGTPSFTYYPLMLVSVASGYSIALPIPGEGASPRAVLERLGKGVVIRVDKDALDSLYEVASMLGAVDENGKPDVSTAAELLASASSTAP